MVIASTLSVKDIPENLRRSGRFEKELLIE